MMTLDDVNGCDEAGFVALLEGIYEETPWVSERAARLRPFATLTALKQAMLAEITAASDAEKLALICAHPELAGDKAAAGELTHASREEQSLAGLTGSLDERLAILNDCNRQYRERFGFPFVLAVKGPDGKGMSLDHIIAALRRRLTARPVDEMRESLRQIHRIAELRLHQRFGQRATRGIKVIEQCDVLAQWSEAPDVLTCTYMSESHRACANALLGWMQDAGMQAHIDAVGNVIGRYISPNPQARTLLTGSHYDTVRNGGKYDGRVGILLPIAVIEQMHRRGEILPFHIDVVGFAEEEGVRFGSAFLGSSALTGRFDHALLDKCDEQGQSLRQALSDAGHAIDDIALAARRSDELIAFLELHIEQGPVLLAEDLPVGVVTAIAGSKRYLVDLKGLAGHAGSTPMTMRRDAAAAAAEITLLVEQRCGQYDGLVGTVGQLQVPRGSVNVIPGACHMSLDIRAGDNATRDAAVDDVFAGIEAICLRRGIDVSISLLLESDTVHCAPWLREHFAVAAAQSGLPVRQLPSGAGHDAVEISQITDVGMLFIRCGNGGISHNPLETVNADDLEMASDVFETVLKRLASV